MKNYGYFLYSPEFSPSFQPSVPLPMASFVFQYTII